MTPSLEALHIEVRIAGEAGQGVLLSGQMLAEMASADGYEVAQSARYGAAVRGGEALADVIVSTEPIDFPLVERPHYLVALSQPTYDRLAPAQAAGTLVIFDPFFVKPQDLPSIRQIRIPATDVAIAELGRATGANVVALAALVEVSSVVGQEAAQTVLERAENPKFRAANRKAWQLGQRLAQEA
ncbi:MAG: 2-oxoacid:acceptor oxidoreductase family protein [Myxococcota bacterium]|jgi:2-oxoglutarate ferredoxin oxidoreductase subunit gamma|nr:2-oxoacid:acceptor oxidoreductase family protein [Myxococcota bacterium]